MVFQVHRIGCVWKTPFSQIESQIIMFCECVEHVQMYICKHFLMKMNILLQYSLSTDM